MTTCFRDVLAVASRHSPVPVGASRLVGVPCPEQRCITYRASRVRDHTRVRMAHSSSAMFRALPHVTTRVRHVFAVSFCHSAVAVGALLVLRTMLVLSSAALLHHLPCMPCTRPHQCEDGTLFICHVLSVTTRDHMLPRRPCRRFSSLPSPCGCFSSCLCCFS